MPRSMIAGMTDYRNQSFDDMVTDLKKWSESLKQVVETITSEIDYLQSVDYWEKVDYDFQSVVCYSLKFYETSKKEIDEILPQMSTEVVTHHINRIRRIYQIAEELNRDYGKRWHQDYDNKEYGNDDFKHVQKIYREGRGMAIDLLDLSNLASRLDDFIGKESSVEDKKRRKRLPWLTLNPNMYGIGIDLRKIPLLKKWLKDSD